MHAGGPGRLDFLHGYRLVLRPIGKVRVAAIVRLHQPDDAVGEIIFDIGHAQDVLAEQPRRPDLAATDEEFDTVKRHRAKFEIVDLRHLGIDRPAKAHDPQAIRRVILFEVIFRRRAGRQRAEKGAAVRDKPHGMPIKRYRHRRLPVDHRHGQLEHLAQMAALVRRLRRARHAQRRRACGHHDPSSHARPPTYSTCTVNDRPAASSTRTAAPRPAHPMSR